MNPLRMVRSLREDFERLGLVVPAEDTASKQKRSVLSESKSKKVLAETGEMHKSELEKGGDWYGVRQEFEAICSEAGVDCEVRPFDQYQGPYAMVSKNNRALGKLWKADSESGDEFYFDGSGGTKETLPEDQMIDFIALHAKQVVGESRRRPGVLKTQTEAEKKDDVSTMKAKGYLYVAQITNKDGSDHGEPLYFKSSSALSSFLRDNPGMKAKWTKKIDEMGEAVSRDDRKDFAGFCKNATDSQLPNIYKKEMDAAKTDEDRIEYADIAKAEMDKRGLSESKETLDEARLKRIRTKKMSATKRAKNRMSKRKRKTKIKRRMKLLKKTSKYKMRVRKLKNLRKKVKGSAGPRRQFRMVAGLEKHGTMLESVRELKFTSVKTVHEEIEAGIRSAMNLAETLMRKFAILDEMVDAPFDSSSLMIETSEVRMEAADVLDRMNTSMMSAADSAAVLKDMVNFLGGALKAYMDIAKDLPKSAYIGWDEAKEENESPEKADGGNQYIGKDKPSEEKTKPEDTSTSTGNVIGKDKIKDEKWGVDGDGSKKQVAGEDQPKEEKQGIESDSGKDNKYIGKDAPSSEKVKPEQQAKM